MHRDRRPHARPQNLGTAVAALATAALVCAGCQGSSAAAPPASSDPHPPSPVAAATAGARTESTSRKEGAVLSKRTYTKPSMDVLRQRLTPLEFEVTQNDATEPPFRNTFWDNHQAGIYVDVATGEPLFSSTDKFESGTGWPSFTRPIEEGRVVSKSDTAFGMVRTEVRSRASGSHLGHVFDDGPAPTGQRYCINSAALRFVPVERLSAEGYPEYQALFGPGAGAAPPPATSNACATPAPGDKPGCETTLETALLGGGDAAGSALRAVPGVLEVEAGKSGASNVLRVVFDPKQLAYRDLLERWATGAKTDRTAFWVNDDQRRVAEQWSPRPSGVTLRRGDVDAFTPVFSASSGAAR